MYAIDINTSFGILPNGTSDYRLATLRELMDATGIAAALTVSQRGIRDDHVAGNAETLAASRADARLIAAATINPLRGLHLERDIAAIAGGGFRAIRFDCGGWGGGWAPDFFIFRPIMRLLAPLRLPILAPAGSLGQISALAAATAEADLPLVLLEASYDTLAELSAAAVEYPHVHLDTSRLAMPNAIETLLPSFGAERILYGSGAPYYAPQSSMNVVFRAQINDQQRAQILHGNAERLLGIAPPPGAPVPARARYYAGKKIDVHAHLHAGDYRFPIEAAGPAVAIADCRHYEIEYMIASSSVGIFYDMVAGNREMKAIIDDIPQFRGYVVVNANDVEGSAAEMDHYYQFENFVGAKIHCEYSQQHTGGEPMRALFAEIAKRGRPVKIHNDGPGWQYAIRDLARAHPQLPIIVAHGGPKGTGAIVAECPNVYLEFCSSRPTRGVIPDALAAVGPERLMYGSDQDLLHPGFVLGTYHDAGFTAEQEHQIMYSNAKRLFRL
ncbi:MAG TPA: amidohydrolase family protein [Roseiflexaceae bacterium]|nr:amidohydrolase family protein [Roseiflexaceae bacterium]